MGRSSREIELDLLRIVALFYVACIHVNARLAGYFSVFSAGWIGMKIWYMSWCVPVFVMISGRFFLDPEKKLTVHRLYMKYIKRIIIAFLVWACVYEIFDAVTGKIRLNLFGHITNAISGAGAATHLWFLFMIAGMYIITPFLRKIVISKRLCEYFLIVFFIYQLLIYYGEHLPFIGKIIKADFDSAQLYFVLGFTAYFLFGYYAKKYMVSKKVERTGYIIGIGAFILAFIGNICVEISGGADTEFFTRYMAPTTFLYSIAVYTLFIKKISKIYYSEKAIQIIEMLAKYGLGMYLLHYMFVWILPIQLLKFCPIVSVPISAALCLCISLAISIILRRVPVIGKYIV